MTTSITLRVSSNCSFLIQNDLKRTTGENRKKYSFLRLQNHDKSKVLCGRNRLSYGEFRVMHLRPLGQLSTGIFQSVFPTNINLFKKLLGRKTGKKTKKYSIFKLENPNKIKDFLRTKIPNGLKFSSQPRYDHFDTSPSMLTRFPEINAVSVSFLLTDQL